jgi:hypothetical protein
MTEINFTRYLDFAKQIQQHYENLSSEKDQCVLQLRAIFAFLRTKYPDLRRIEISYDGCGDSGHIDSTCFGSDCDLWKHSTNLKVDDSEVLPNEIACGHTVRKGHWCNERSEWVHDEELRNENIADALDRIGWDIAYGENPGFENNEGSYGTVSVSTDGDSDEIRVNLEHSERYESTIDTSYTY